MSTPSGPPRSFFYYGLIFAIIVIVILGILESRSLNASSPTPATTSRPIHTHRGSDVPVLEEARRKTAPTTVVALDTERAADAGSELTATFDGGSEDPTTRRDAIFNAWWPQSPDWILADRALKNCTRVQFVHVFVGYTPEDAMEVCLNLLHEEELNFQERRDLQAVKIEEDFE